MGPPTQSELLGWMGTRKYGEQDDVSQIELHNLKCKLSNEPRREEGGKGRCRWADGRFVVAGEELLNGMSPVSTGGSEPIPANRIRQRACENL